MNKRTLGSIFWISTAQYFVIQVIVAAAYIGHFSLSNNTISDLGNSVCGIYNDRYVCSPLHGLMNISFVILGITQLLGAIFYRKVAQKNIRNIVGYNLMVLAGLGTILVGLYPENTVGSLHALGAVLPFLFGNIAMLLLARQPGFPKWLSFFSYISGIVGLIALILFMTATYLGIGQGGMERGIAYPQTIWMIIVGMCYIFANTDKKVD